MEINIEHRIPSVEEYQQLRRSTDWSNIDDLMVSTMLSNTLFAVCITFDGRFIATGRITGDGAYFYIQDVIVFPNYRKKGLGRNIMQEFENWIDKSVKPKAFIEFSEHTKGAEEPTALILQKEYIDEVEAGIYKHIKEKRLTEWPVEFLSRPKRNENTIPDFLAPNAPENKLDILRGIAE